MFLYDTLYDHYQFLHFQFYLNIKMQIYLDYPLINATNEIVCKIVKSYYNCIKVNRKRINYLIVIYSKRETDWGL